jgi:citronellol/citronellal dehydrogenase
VCSSDLHPRLPGTIYSSAEEIEAAGGQALPVVVDVRSEEAVQAAVDQAVERFGGIDILVNNASAISLTGTLETSLKRFDLMHQVNTRGTWLTSKLCLPHLVKSDHAHILNISPPLNMSPFWFGAHVAYTMAKYGMSMCVLGMAEEFKGKVGVNALWPRTAIATSAVKNLLGGEAVVSMSRKPEIMADAAHVLLRRDPRRFTGNFAIDDTVLEEDGVTDFDQYAVVPGNALAPDFFL